MSDATKPGCACNGFVAPNGICGYVLVNEKGCGAPADYECRHKEPRGERRRVAYLGDKMQVSMKYPSPQTLKVTLTSPEAVAEANKLLADPNSDWELVSTHNSHSHV